ncbi:hypothetical protein [Agrobacterium tumefaciens]|uniref:hypothetical protein n=1 Tax=Agrobacterium tumefaciens TaxID=358 RepID=UPI00157212A1|nr:hypothetical protein [Agrobacterium tumefaciens]WCJ63911.1 hypothetical protein G6M15_06910 [Agrobacterium tumefaciens]
MTKIYWKIYGIVSITLSAAGIATRVYEFDPYVVISIPAVFVSLTVCLYAFDVAWKPETAKRATCTALAVYAALWSAWVFVELYRLDTFEIAVLTVFATTLLMTILDITAIWRYGIAKPSQGQDASKTKDFPDTMVT